MKDPVTPRTSPTFWRSPGGVATAIGLGAAAAGGIAYAVSKSSAAAPAPTPTTSNLTVIPTHWYLFQVTSGATNPEAALEGLGLTSVQAEPDPINAGNWIATAYNGTATSLPPSWSLPSAGSINGALDDLGTTAPPVPTAWEADNGSGTGTVSLVVSDWYSFSIRTSFQSGTPHAAKTVSDMLVNYGWGGAMVTTAADTSSTPDTWNVYAQWDGSSVSTTDAPPLWILIPQKSIPGLATPTPAMGPIDMGAMAPTAAPPNTMPW